jgi:chaperonin GroES
MTWEIDEAIDIHTLVACPNICELMDADDLSHLGFRVCENFVADQNSRREWEKRMGKAMELALQVVEKKTFPWENAANVKLPLITTAALQYQSRAYPALLNGPMPVAAKAIKPGDQQEEARAVRIKMHMSFQILEEMLDWEEEQDKAFLIQAIMGCVFKKTWYDPIRGINRSVCVNPRDLVVNYWATSVEECQRVTHVMYMSHNAVREMQLTDLFCEFKDGTKHAQLPTLRDGNGIDKRQGTNPPPVDSDTPYELLEQCVYLDLDNDGYREPYVVTVRYDSRQVLRIAPLYTRKDITWTVPRKGSSKKPQVLRIAPCGMYTKYTFIPSPDGGFYDLGLGALLGPVSEIIDSALNQMLDAGTLQNAGGGFLGKGAKLKKGDIHQSPGKWTTLDCIGADMKDNILPLPVPAPSEALFKLVQLLIEWGQNVIGATDLLLGGNPGQNTPAQTSQTMVEQGMTTFNGIYKRTHKAFTRELQKLFRLNVNFLADGKTSYYDAKGNSAEIFDADYSPTGINLIRPAANPFYMSDVQRMNQAQAIFTASVQMPGFDRYQATLYWLEAWKVQDPDRFVINPQFFLDDQKLQQAGKPPSGKVPAGAQPMPNPKMMEVQVKQDLAATKKMEAQGKLKVMMDELEQQESKLQAEIALLSAQAAEAIANADGVKEGHQIAMLEAQIGAKNSHLDSVIKAMSLAHEMIKTQDKGEEDDANREHERSMASLAAKSSNTGSSGGA